MGAYDGETGLSSPGLLAVAVAAAVALLLHFGAEARVEVVAAGFIIIGYTVWTALATWRDVRLNAAWRQYVSTLPANRPRRRVARLMRDGGFWRSLVSGTALVVTGVWYAGVEQPALLAALGGGWSMLAGGLNYELTLLHPTTRCRDCQYDLTGHLDPDQPDQRVTCPECGRTWDKAALCLTASPTASPPAPPPSRRPVQSQPADAEPAAAR